MAHLLMIHIGPVQDFIATARRSRDLWFGSWLLSELSKAAALAIVEHEDNVLERLIFPAPDDLADLQPDSDLIVANKIVALVSEPPTLEAAGDYVQQAIWSRLRAIRRQAYKFVNGYPYDKAVAKAQVDDLPEYFWVSVPFDEAEYTTVRKRAEALMHARKMTRNFDAVGWGAAAPKSSLDGIRESVIPEEAFPDRDDSDEARQAKIEDLFTRYGAKPAERLSGLDLLKRHGFRGHVAGFPSTSHIASLPLRRRLEQRADLKPDWHAYRQLFPDELLRQERVPSAFAGHPLFAETDGSLLFESRLREYLEEPLFTAAKKQLRQFLQKAADGQEPIPYYALLLADGDRMGQVIDTQTSAEQHRQFSRVLTAFAGEVHTIVTRHEGALVYAGGDDVLAFVPLHKALACAQTLASTFHQAMENARLKDKNGQTPTFSAGLAISHHLEPLSDALRLVRQTEREAKSVEGKNALAISVDMRSGVVRTVAGHWDELDVRLQKFTDYHRLEAIPDGAAYQLRDTALRLGGDQAIGQSKSLQAVAQAESIRILGRKRAQRGTQQLAEETLEALTTLVKNESLPLEQLADELIIARLFAKALDQADGAEGRQGGDA